MSRRVVIAAVACAALTAVIGTPHAPAAEPAIARIELHPAVIEVEPDTEVSYTVEAFDADGASLGPVDAEIRIQHPPRWAPPGYATVSSEGFCPGATCRSTYAGDNTIMAVLGDLTTTAVMTVRPGDPRASG